MRKLPKPPCSRETLSTKAALSRTDLIFFSTSPPLIGVTATFVAKLKRLFSFGKHVPRVYWAMDLNPDQLIAMKKLKADVVIVGSGAGGAPCAAELASRGIKVVIVEEGHRWEPKSFPARYGWALNHLYQDQGARVVEADTIYPMPAGKGVGGSTLGASGSIDSRSPVLTRT